MRGYTCIAITRRKLHLYRERFPSAEAFFVDAKGNVFPGEITRKALTKKEPFRIYYREWKEAEGERRGVTGSIIPFEDGKIVKLFSDPWLNSYTSFITEIAALRYLHMEEKGNLVTTHPNVIKPLGVVLYAREGKLNYWDLQDMRIGIVLAEGCVSLQEWYMFTKDIHTHIRKCTVGEYRRPTLIPCILYQILSGVLYIHQRGLVHNDLKPANIIVYADGSLPLVQIADLGAAQYGITHDPQAKLSANVVTLWWRAPEIVLGKMGKSKRVHYEYSADMWSLGVIFYNLLSFEHLFQSDNEQELAQDIGEMYDAKGEFAPGILAKLGAEGKRHPWVTDAALDLLRKMLTINPEERISTEEALRHPYFKDPLVEEVKALYTIPSTQGKDCEIVTIGSSSPSDPIVSSDILKLVTRLRLSLAEAQLAAYIYPRLTSLHARRHEAMFVSVYAAHILLVYSIGINDFIYAIREQYNEYLSPMRVEEIFFTGMREIAFDIYRPIPQLVVEFCVGIPPPDIYINIQSIASLSLMLTLPLSLRETAAVIAWLSEQLAGYSIVCPPRRHVETFLRALSEGRIDQAFFRQMQGIFSTMTLVESSGKCPYMLARIT